MNFLDYIYPLRKWWWLLVAAALVSGISSAVVSFMQPPIYQTRTTLIIGNTMTTLNPGGGEIYLQQQLASIYAEYAYREPIRQATMNALQLTALPTYTVRAVSNTSLIEIVVSDTVPQRTQAVANELANQLVLRSPGVNQQDSQTQDFLREQLNGLQLQIDDTLAKMKTLQDELSNSSSARQISDLNEQISELDSRLNTLRSTYGTLLSNTQSGATNTLSVVEQAALPAQPVGPNHLMNIIIGLGAALVLAAGTAYIIEFLDNSVKNAEDVKRILQLPIVGEVEEFPHGKDPWSYVKEEPRSPVAHAFRVLRTNLDLLEPENPVRTFLITSAEMAEGKSTIAANLAVVMSQGNRKVICVDADFHRPVLHNVVSLTNDYGLSNVFKDSVDIKDVIMPWGDGNLKLIPAGKFSANPSELLGSRKMDEIINSLKSLADVIILDGPPFFLSDASALSAKVDCVILVIRPGHTRKDAVKAMKEQITKLNLKNTVVILNRISRKESYYSKYYPYNYKDYSG